MADFEVVPGGDDGSTGDFCTLWWIGFMANSGQGSDHWGAHARHWDNVGAPLRPGLKDTRVIERWVHGIQSVRSSELLVALLGVTPEIVSLRWPAGARLIAIDRCMGMIREVFPGPAEAGGAQALCGDWLRLPLARDSIDLVVGDGCFTLMPDLSAYQRLSSEVRRVLRPGGVFMIRLFVRPEISESVEAVFEDLRALRIGSFHAFKWRLAMAMQQDFPAGIVVRDIWDRWVGEGLDISALAARTGWPEREIRTIEAYRGSEARYTFPTLAEASAQLSGGFIERACETPDYELGDRCPTLLLERRAGEDGDR